MLLEETIEYQEHLTKQQLRGSCYCQQQEPKQKKGVASQTDSSSWVLCMVLHPFSITTITTKNFTTYLAGPFASFIMELPGSHHHWLVNHLPSFLLRELFILLLWWWGPRRRDFTFRQRWFGRSKLICQLRKNYQVLSKALGTIPPFLEFFLSSKKHPQKSHLHSLHIRPPALVSTEAYFLPFFSTKS